MFHTSINLGPPAKKIATSHNWLSGIHCLTSKRHNLKCNSDSLYDLGMKNSEVKGYLGVTKDLVVKRR